MKVHNRDVPLQAPNFCFVCERSPEPEEPIVDTQRSFSSAKVRTRLDGRKYLCVGCIDEAAGLLGYVSPAGAQQLKDAAAHANGEAEFHKAQVALQDAIKEAVDKLAILRVEDTRAEAAPEAPKAKPRAKKAAAKS